MFFLSYGQQYNIVLSIKSSNKQSLHLICKHGRVYRNVEKEEANSENAAKKRDTNSQKIGCGCYVQASPQKSGEWVTNSWDARHIHPIPARTDVYSKHRAQLETVETKILTLFRQGMTPSHVHKVLLADGVTNIIKKDLENK